METRISALMEPPPVWRIGEQVALAVGALAASLALYGRYRVLPTFLTGPQVCRLEAGGCQALFRTPTASVLGAPNALLGLAMYGFIAAGLIWRLPPPWLLAAASGGLAMSVYLARYLLLNRLECRICWAGHIANLVLWTALLIRTLGTAPSGFAEGLHANS